MTLRPVAVFAAILSLAITALCAHADTLQTFQVQNSFVYPSLPLTPIGSMTGTLVIDTTSGQFVSGDLTYVDGATTILFNSSSLFTSFVPGHSVYTNFSSGIYGLNFELSATSLVGYSGGSICGASAPCGSIGYITANGDAYAWSASGSLTPTPEPASFLLLGTGLLGLGLTAKRRFMA